MIVIGGGGAVALAFALAARRRAAGRALRIVGGGGGAPSGGRYFSLGRRAMRFLRRLGVSPPASPVTRMELRAGRRFLPIGGGGGAGGADLCRIVSEDDLCAALRRRAAAENIPIADGGEIRHAETTARGIRLTIDGDETEAALLVAADGGRSPLAAALNLLPTATSFRQSAVVAVAETAGLPAETAAQWLADGGAAALLPIDGIAAPAAGGRRAFCLIWSTRRPPADEELAARLAERTGLEDIAIRADSPIRRFPLFSVRRGAVVAQRAALIGDAAGVIHPLAGQGLNLGLRNAECLAACIRPDDAGAAIGLAAYAATARRGDWMRDLTSLLADSAATAEFLFAAAKLPGMRTFATLLANR